MTSEPTRDEIAASRAFGEALIRLLVAHEEGKRQRRPPFVQPKATKPAPSPQEDEPEDTKLLLSAKEAARALSISVRSLHTHSKPRGPIPAVRLGGRVLYSMDDLRAWIEQAKSEDSGC